MDCRKVQFHPQFIIAKDDFSLYEVCKPCCSVIEQSLASSPLLEQAIEAFQDGRQVGHEVGYRRGNREPEDSPRFRHWEEKVRADSLHVDVYESEITDYYEGEWGCQDDPYESDDLDDDEYEVPDLLGEFWEHYQQDDFHWQEEIARWTELVAHLEVGKVSSEQAGASLAEARAKLNEVQEGYAAWKEKSNAPRQRLLVLQAAELRPQEAREQERQKRWDEHEKRRRAQDERRKKRQELMAQECQSTRSLKEPVLRYSSNLSQPFSIGFSKGYASGLHQVEAEEDEEQQLLDDEEEEQREEEEEWWD